MNSRERMLAAIDCQTPDHAPCSFMLHTALLSTSCDYCTFIEQQVAMGLDAFVMLPPRAPVEVNDTFDLYGLPVSHDPRVQISEWSERPTGETTPILIKAYRTPAGTLRAEVRQTDDWPWGSHVPFLDDYMIPRSRKFLIGGRRDLDALRYLLVPPSKAQIAAFKEQARSMQELARRHGLLTTSGWSVGADMVGWIYGLESMMFAVYDQPDFVKEMLDIIAVWSRSRMAVTLDAGVDLIIKRGWYENSDFFAPSTWRTLIYPNLKADVEQAHSKGARFAYIITSSCMPLLDMLAECGVDVLIGVDPGEWDMAAAKRKLAGKVCLWGGVSGHLTVEQRSAAEVRAEVARAMEVLAPGGGFILSPVDNVRENTPRARRNTKALISEWRKLTGQAQN